MLLAADCIRREVDRPKSRPGWGTQSVFLVGDRGHKGGTIATPHGPNCWNFWAGIRAHFGAQIPGTKSSPDSGPLVRFNTYGPESGLDSVPGIWAPKCARIPAQKNRRSGPRPSQKTGCLLLHFCPGNLTSSTALLMLGSPPCCRYLGGTCNPSSQQPTASLNAVEALVSSSGKAAAPEQWPCALCG